MSDAAIVRVVTSMRDDEVAAMEMLGQSVSGGHRPMQTRAGAARAMIRFALEHDEQFVQWMERQT